jgi:hypothetical protein
VLLLSHFLDTDLFWVPPANDDERAEADAA